MSSKPLGCLGMPRRPKARHVKPVTKSVARQAQGMSANVVLMSMPRFSFITADQVGRFMKEYGAVRRFPPHLR
jgi:hypothetical protein